MLPVGEEKTEFNSLLLVIVQNNCYSRILTFWRFMCVEGEIAVGFSPGIQFPIFSISVEEAK